MVWDHCEASPFGGISGSWRSSVDSQISAIHGGSFASSVMAQVTQGTATHLNYGPETFDVVVADPPYYDAVPCSSLSGFYCVWLKNSIGNLYPELFHTGFVPHSEEITSQRPIESQHTNDWITYEFQLQQALSEVFRVLKPGGTLTVIFGPTKSSSVFEVLLSGLVAAGFVVTTLWPLEGNTSGYVQLEDAMPTPSSHSVIVVCRKALRSVSDVGNFLRVRADVRARVRETLQICQTQGFKAEYGFLIAAGRAMEVFGKYVQVTNENGESTTVSDILNIAREEVEDHALRLQASRDYRPSGMSTLQARALVRYNVRQRLEPFADQTHWLTDFFIDRIDLAEVAFEYRYARKADGSSVELQTLLGFVIDEFRDFVHLHDSMVGNDTSRRRRDLICERCSKKFDFTGDDHCPHCGNPNLFQIAETSLVEILDLVGIDSEDPIARRILASTEQIRLDSAYKGLPAAFESFMRRLDSHIFKTNNRRPEKLTRPNLFQNLSGTNDWFGSHHHISIFQSLSSKEFAQLDMVFNKRHVLTHTGGLMDERYVKNTEGELEQIGKPVRLDKIEIEQATRSMRLIISNMRQMITHDVSTLLPSSSDS